MGSQSSSDRRLIKSIQRAIDILELYDNTHPELGITDIARRLDLPKSTVSGIIHTLEINDYLSQNPRTRKYRLGMRLAERGETLLNHLDIRQVSLDELEKLRDWCNETVNLAILDSDKILYIERLLGSNRLGMRSEVGRREPVHSTALGKAILAFQPHSKQLAFIEKHSLTSITPKTITEADKFIEELEKTCARGFSLDDEENELGGRCVGAPIFDYTGRPVAGISISVPITRFPEEKIPVFGQEVSKVAAEISKKMGHQH